MQPTYRKETEDQKAQAIDSRRFVPVDATSAKRLKNAAERVPLAPPTPKAIVLPAWQRPYGVPKFRPTPEDEILSNCETELEATAQALRLHSYDAFRALRSELLGERLGDSDLFAVCLPSAERR